ncbi:hypothetical protein [Alcaligenes faecalis]|uniref:hypothetical protein n=1 Tax=Alcaligenes faecalis TaxID=511 RepID=UPI0034D6936F
MQKENCDYEGLMLIVFLVGVGFGCVIGFSLLFAFNDSLVLKGVLLKWQTLVAGLIAFLASFLLLCSAVYSDIETRRKNAFSARVFLPHSLTKINDYLECSVSFYKKYLSGLESDKDVYFPPDISDEWFSELRLLAGTEGKDMAKVIACFVLDLQIFNSRMKSRFQETRKGNDVQSWAVFDGVVSVMFLSHILGRMYDYARGKTKFDFSVISHQELSLSLVDYGFGSIEKKYLDLEEYAAEMIIGKSPLTGFYGAVLK